MLIIHSGADRLLQVDTKIYFCIFGVKTLNPIR